MSINLQMLMIDHRFSQTRCTTRGLGSVTTLDWLFLWHGAWGTWCIGMEFRSFLLCISAGLGMLLSLAFCFVLLALVYGVCFGSTFFCSFCFVPAL